jgi:hypothetical protein
VQAPSDPTDSSAQSWLTAKLDRRDHGIVKTSGGRP